MGARPVLNLILRRNGLILRRNGFQVITNDDFLEEGGVTADNATLRMAYGFIKLLRQGYRYHKLRKAFSKFYRRHFDIVSKYNVGLKTLLLQGLSEPEFYFFINSEK